MAKKINDLDIDPYDLLRNNTEELYKLRRKLAKRANQRLLRLERGTSKITGEKLSYGAYDIAQSYLKATGRTSGRFSEVLSPKDMSDGYVAREVMELQKFLSMKSSTVKGMREIEKKRVEAFESKGISKEMAEDPEFYKFLNSQTYELMSSLVDSDKIIDFMHRAYSSGASVDEIVNAFNKYADDRVNTGEQITIKGISNVIDGLILDNSENN